MREGEGAGAMMSGPLINGSSQTVAPFQFPFIVLDGRVAFFYFQTLLPSIQPSSPFNFNLVAFQFPNPVAFPFPPLILDGHGVLDATAVR
jgi:hypothetical protein